MQYSAERYNASGENDKQRFHVLPRYRARLLSPLLRKDSRSIRGSIVRRGGRQAGGRKNFSCPSEEDKEVSLSLFFFFLEKERARARESSIDFGRANRRLAKIRAVLFSRTCVAKSYAPCVISARNGRADPSDNHTLRILVLTYSSEVYKLTIEGDK